MIYGFPAGTGPRPTRYVGRHNTYIYFPVAWTDTCDGKKYDPGYYDEDGKRYENVAFAEEDGSYKNVLCECEYCGTRKVMDVDAGGSLHCESCGGTMKIVGTVDELIRKETVDENTDRGDDSHTFESVGKQLIRSLLSVYFVSMLFIGIFTSMIKNMAGSYGERVEYGYYDDNQVIPFEEEYGGNTGYSEYYEYDDIFLSSSGDNTFVITDEESSCDKYLTWLDEYESWYDSESDCYLWYNEDLDPPIWQYWYEEISSDFGDYGWMEYDEYEQTWYIEQDEGDWIRLPSQYDASALWHIE